MSESEIADRRQVGQIMSRILSERPEYWPYGLSIGHMNGGTWLVRKKASKEPVGFLGWQRFREGGKTVGNYAIGILPEFRGQGYGKAALSELLAAKSASVDEVRALVMETNTPSRRLADALNIPVTTVKSAFMQKLLGAANATGSFLSKPAVAGPLGAVGVDAMLEQRHQQAVNPGADFSFGKWMSSLDPRKDMFRPANLLLNAGLLGSGTKMLQGGDTVKGIGTMSSIIPKDIGLQALGMMPAIRQNVDTMAAGTHPALAKEGWSGMSGLEKTGITAAGVTLLGLLAMSLRNQQKQLHTAEEDTRRRQGGTLRVTLPTKDPNDTETQIEMPLASMPLSNTILGRLGRDTRRRLRYEQNINTKRRPLTLS